MELGAPAAAAYKGHSSGILDVLEDLKEKARTFICRYLTHFMVFNNYLAVILYF